MSALASREQRLQSELDVALEREGAEQAETPAGVHVLELRQELSHVRKAEAWLEARFVEQWTSWEQRSNHAPAGEPMIASRSSSRIGSLSLF